jgi:hypothetical protein
VRAQVRQLRHGPTIARRRGGAAPEPPLD